MGIVFAKLATIKNNRKPQLAQVYMWVDLDDDNKIPAKEALSEIYDWLLTTRDRSILQQLG